MIPLVIDLSAMIDPDPNKEPMGVEVPPYELTDKQSATLLMAFLSGWSREDHAQLWAAMAGENAMLYPHYDYERRRTI
jgi:hypothetical protein